MLHTKCVLNENVYIMFLEFVNFYLVVSFN